MAHYGKWATVGVSDVVCSGVVIYIYIYIYRERERERGGGELLHKALD